jgi:hypothetical protein
MSVAQTSSSSAVFSDHFDGTKLDASKWSIQENAPLPTINPAHSDLSLPMQSKSSQENPQGVFIPAEIIYGIISSIAIGVVAIMAIRRTKNVNSKT